MADDIRKAFTFNLRLSNKKTKEMSEQIDHDENAVSIHVRRGDYLEPKYWKTTGCVCQLPYYLNAIAEMNKRISQPSYYVSRTTLPGWKKTCRCQKPSLSTGTKVQKAGRIWCWWAAAVTTLSVTVRSAGGEHGWTRGKIKPSSCPNAGSGIAKHRTSVPTNG